MTVNFPPTAVARVWTFRGRTQKDDTRESLPMQMRTQHNGARTTGKKENKRSHVQRREKKKTGRTGVYEIIMNIKRPRGRWSHAKRDIAAYVIRSAIFISMMHSKVGSSSSADAGRGRLDWKTFTEPTLSFYSFFYLKSKGRGEIWRRKWLCTVDDRPVKPTQKNVFFFNQMYYIQFRSNWFDQSHDSVRYYCRERKKKTIM